MQITYIHCFRDNVEYTLHASVDETWCISKILVDKILVSCSIGTYHGQIPLEKDFKYLIRAKYT